MLALLMFSGTSQSASSGTVSFTGELVNDTCNVSIGGKGPDGVVVLPAVATSLLQTPGQTAGMTRFLMSMSDCEGSKRGVAAYFEAGPTVDTLTGRLKNVNSSGATNVSLQLYDDANKKVIHAGNSSQLAGPAYYVADQVTVMVYSVQYYAEGATTSGLVNSSVVYSLMYR